MTNIKKLKKKMYGNLILKNLYIKMSSIIVKNTQTTQSGAKALDNTSGAVALGNKSAKAGELAVIALNHAAASKSTRAKWKTVEKAEPKEHSFSMQYLRVKSTDVKAEATLNAYAKKKGKKGWLFHVVTESNKTAGQVVGEVIFTGPTKVRGKEVFDFLMSGVPVELMVPRRGLGKPMICSMTGSSLYELLPDCQEMRKLNNYRVHKWNAGKKTKGVIRVAAGKYKIFFTVWGEVHEALREFVTVHQEWEESEAEKKFRMSTAKRSEKNRQNQKRRSAWKKAAAGKREAKVEKKSAPKPISVQPAPEKVWVSENLAEKVEKLSVEEFPELGQQENSYWQEDEEVEEFGA